MRSEHLYVTVSLGVAALLPVCVHGKQSVKAMAEQAPAGL
jgi:hypothetical protein